MRFFTPLALVVALLFGKWMITVEVPRRLNVSKMENGFTCILTNDKVLNRVFNRLMGETRRKIYKISSESFGHSHFKGIQGLNACLFYLFVFFYNINSSFYASS